MRGFQPAAHLVPKYADGGLVQRALGLFGGRKKQIDDAVKVASQDTRQASAPAPEPVKTTPDGKFDEKRTSKDNPAGISFADGGLVRGPGTGTSDDVPDKVPDGTYIMPADSTEAIGPENLARAGARGLPMPGGKKVDVRLSNGEFKLPPEQVHAVGVQALEQAKKATHTPVARGLPMPNKQGKEPPLFFSGGGLVEEEDNASRFVKVPPGIGGNPGAPAPAQLAPAPAPAPAQPSPAATPAPRGFAPTAAPPAPTTDWKQVGRQLESMGYPQNPAQPPAAAPPAQPPAPAQDGPRGFSYQENNQAVGRDIKDSWNKGNYGEAVGKTVAGTVGMFSTPIIDAAGAVAEGAKGFGRGLFGIDSKPDAATPPAQGAAPPATPSAATPATATLNSALEAQRRRDAIAGTGASTGTEGAAAAPTAQAPQGREVVPGAYAHGRGQYSDQAQGMGFAPGFTGKPNAQNMAAADALAQRSQAEAMNRVARGFAPAGTASAAAPASGGENFDWMKDLRDPRTLALRNAGVGSTIFRNKGEEITANKARQARVAGVQQAINDRMHDAQQAETTRYQSDNTLAGYIATEQMRQDGANTRDAGRNALTAEELGLRREAAGFQTRAAAQQEQLRNVLLDPKSTPEQRAVAQRNLAALSGKTAADRMQTVALPDTTNEMGQVVRGGQALVRVLEDGSVQQVPIGTQAPAPQGGLPKVTTPQDLAALKSGTKFVDANGVERIKK